MVASPHALLIIVAGVREVDRVAARLIHSLHGLQGQLTLPSDVTNALDLKAMSSLPIPPHTPRMNLLSVPPSSTRYAYCGVRVCVYAAHLLLIDITANRGHQ